MANVCNVISAIRKCREGTGRLLYGHPIYKMTGPRSTAITSEAAALDAQTRANMQNLPLEVLATEGKTVMLITHSVEEAIYLASRIVVVTAIVALRSDIRELVMSEYRAQQALALPASFSE
ncbi:MAG TPA: hypothetical protein VK678_07790 [Bradyrhizobium sp.]|nr:hypothetical protein [Bradyrhizobium sp.]